MKTNGKHSSAVNGKAGEPAPVVDVRFFGGLWRYEVVMPSGRRTEGFRSSKASAEEAAQLWIGAQK